MIDRLHDHGGCGLHKKAFCGKNLNPLLYFILRNNRYGSLSFIEYPENRFSSHRLSGTYPFRDCGLRLIKLLQVIRTASVSLVDRTAGLCLDS